MSIRRIRIRGGVRGASGPILLSAPSWSPADIADAFAWYRADQGVTLVGSDVSALADLSGNGRHLSEATNRPLFNASNANFNGQPTITFDGAAEKIGRASFDLGASGTGFTLFLVAEVLSDVANATLAGYSANNVGLRLAFVTPDYFLQGRVAGVNINTTYDPTGAEGYLLYLDDPGNATEILVAGTPVVTVDPFGSTIAATGDFYLGANGSGTSFCNVALAECLVLSRPPSAEEITLLTTYAAARYGV